MIGILIVYALEEVWGYVASVIFLPKMHTLSLILSKVDKVQWTGILQNAWPDGQSH